MINQTNKSNFIYRDISTTKKGLQLLLIGLLLQLGLSSGLYAGTGKFTQYDATNTSQAGTNQFKVAIRPLSGCGVEETLPYVVIFVGTPGYLVNSDVQTKYYTGAAEKIAVELEDEGRCVRTVIIETTEEYRKYRGNGSVTQNKSVDVGAAYIYDILVSLQAHDHFKDASRWYLMGGSAGSLMSVKLLDNEFRSPGRTTVLDQPAGVILESLPSSGSVFEDCKKVSPASSYEASLNSRNNNCSSVLDPSQSSRNPIFEFLNGEGIRNYMDLGKKIFILQGANDPLFKESLKSTGSDPTYKSGETGWTMVGVLSNFVKVTQLASTCGQVDGATATVEDTMTISNTQKTWSCYSERLFARTYPNSGHSPMRNNGTAVQDLGNIIDTTQ